MRVNLAVTVDVDNDGVSLTNERNKLSWESLKIIPRLKEVFENCGVQATWFVRADNQLQDLYGSPAYLLHEHRELWQSLQSSGDEIAWHPHLYHRETPDEGYVTDLNPARCAEKLRGIHNGLKNSGFGFRSVRIGEAFHANETMRELDRVGLKVDSTAIPGRRREDPARFFDWEATPNKPYHPATEDYRVSAANRLGILEVPMTTAKFQAAYDAQPCTRYVNLAYHHAIFAAGIDEFLGHFQSAANSQYFLTTIVHPDEIRTAREPHGLYAFSLAEVEKNLRYLVQAFEQRKTEWQPVRLQDVPALVKQA